MFFFVFFVLGCGGRRTSFQLAQRNLSLFNSPVQATKHQFDPFVILSYPTYMSSFFGWIFCNISSALLLKVPLKIVFFTTLLKGDLTQKNIKKHFKHMTCFKAFFVRNPCSDCNFAHFQAKKLQNSTKLHGQTMEIHEFSLNSPAKRQKPFRSTRSNVNKSGSRP